jgi:predicted esterase
MKFYKSVPYMVVLTLIMLFLGGYDILHSAPETTPTDIQVGDSPMPTDSNVAQLIPTDPPVSPDAHLVGHEIEGKNVTFVFDGAVYGLEGDVVSVAVVGNFNEWADTMDEWQLRDDDNDNIWTLGLPLGNQIKIGAAFIFVADGRKLQPPSEIDENYFLPDDAGRRYLIIGGLADLSSQDKIISRLVRKSYTNAQGHTLSYHLLIPQEYDPSQVYPLVVFLHGAGERGDNIAPVLPYNGGYEFMETASKYSYFMLIPQAPRGTWWGGQKIKQLVLQLVDDTRGQFSIDPARIYITGLSMGAFGMWEMIIQEPDTFAAGISVCGGTRNTDAASQIAYIPLQVFHGSDDSVVPVEVSRTIVNALQEAGGTIRYTEYEEADHWIWERTYTNPEVIDWLFRQKKGM